MHTHAYFSVSGSFIPVGHLFPTVDARNESPFCVGIYRFTVLLQFEVAHEVDLDPSYSRILQEFLLFQDCCFAWTTSSTRAQTLILDASPLHALGEEK
jgi:hypothetical protein